MFTRSAISRTRSGCPYKGKLVVQELGPVIQEPVVVTAAMQEVLDGNQELRTFAQMSLAALHRVHAAAVNKGNRDGEALLALVAVMPTLVGPMTAESVGMLNGRLIGHVGKIQNAMGQMKQIAQLAGVPAEEVANLANFYHA
jgi:hypothetical protein